MKKAIVPLFFMIATAVALLGFVGFDKAGPKEVAKIWLIGFYHMDYEAAKKVSTADTKVLLTQLSALSSMMPDSTKNELKNISVTIKDVREEGDKASVYYDLSDVGRETPADLPPLKLIKTDGQWLVQVTKNDAGLNNGNDPKTPTLDNEQTGEPPKVPNEK